ncbi:site-specific integrase [Microbacterium sp. VKM Ac-2923]|uniref:tyrosine-type recombinase/integrase n=1 Tax=Microbacterium sp. VKM Ac-2923 TaxID=2929476 RepID=UPI001FB4D98D|nr:site-specific integrase [Microbacterium sp. VKM Ac-2923]MCJ1707419.1 site-specific integrase [Microbacterium sp. VKM Ac-2923]
MTISKTPQGRWRARVKSGRDVVASRTFDLKRDAEAWESAQRRMLDLGEFVDPRAGRESLASALERWKEQRRGTVASKTLSTEGYALKHLPTAMRNRPLAAIRASELEALYSTLLRTQARATVCRFRNIISAFWTWAVAERIIPRNIAIESKVPKGRGEDATREIYPFTLDELRAVHADLSQHTTQANADIALILGLTGLRWGELSALRVRDVQQLPYPAFRVSRSKPDGQPVRTVTKGGSARTVPLPAEVAAIVLPMLEGRTPDAPLFPSATGSNRSGRNWTRDAHWSDFGRGRRVHDLRHTAATLWLSSGVDLKTAQTWLGHSTAKLTADTYAHFLGSDADTAALARMNAVLSDAGGRRGDALVDNLALSGKRKTEESAGSRG